MARKRHICFFTGKRGGFTHLIPIIELVRKTATLSYSVIACDMHLMPRFGSTVEQVRVWSENVYSLETAMGSDSKCGRAKSLGIAILGLSELLSEIRPDVVFVLGDRGEVLAMTICAVELNIPVAHLFGGDVCQGGVDEPVRHAITKLSSLHLVSNPQSAERIKRMGEEPWRIHTVGAPALDLIAQKQYASAHEMRERFGLDLNKPILVLLQHSVTWQVEDAERQMRETMEALDKLQYQTIAVYPCSDPGYQAMISVLEEYRSRPYLQIFSNIDFSDFWGLMGVASAFVGNSSAGVMETPAFRVPFVNIGIRQKDRLRADNVLDVDHDRDEIAAAVNTALFDEAFRAKVRVCQSPYGDGHAAERTVDILENLTLDERLVQKRLTY